jgi:hypothetical protein
MPTRNNPVLEDLVRLRRELAALNKMSIRVGVLGSAGGEMLTIANVHEFGCTIEVTPKMRGYFRHNFGVNLRGDTNAINIPERSFIRASFDTGQEQLAKTVKNAFGKVIRGDKTAQQAMEEIGLLAAQMTQMFINEGNVKPPNSELTLDRKSQKTPLVDSGRLVNSITFEVRGG